MFFNNKSAYQDGQAMALKIKAMQDRQARSGPQGKAVSKSARPVHDRQECNVRTPSKLHPKDSKQDVSTQSSPHRLSIFGRKPKTGQIRTDDTLLHGTIETSSCPETSTVVSTYSTESRQAETTQDAKLAQAEQTLQLINDTIASQERRDDQLDQEISSLLQEARTKLAAGNKRSAVRLLKKMKLKQHEQAKVGHVIETMEAQVLTIESAIENAKVLRAMQQGATTMKSLRDSDQTSVEAFDSVLLDIKDTMDYAEEIQQILAEPVGNVVLDDDELLLELEKELNRDFGDGAANATVLDIDMPSAPNTMIHSSKQATNNSLSASAHPTMMMEI
jgi:charged multivesicular body protein 4A/B